MVHIYKTKIFYVTSSFNRVTGMKYEPSYLISQVYNEIPGTGSMSKKVKDISNVAEHLKLIVDSLRGHNKELGDGIVICITDSNLTEKDKLRLKQNLGDLIEFNLF